MNRRELLVGTSAVAIAAVLPVAAEQIGYVLALASDDGLNWRPLSPIIIKHHPKGFYMYVSNVSDYENSEIGCYETESDNLMFADWKRIGNLDGRQHRRSTPQVSKQADQPEPGENFCESPPPRPTPASED
jgi:hypothetical protein